MQYIAKNIFIAIKTIAKQYISIPKRGNYKIIAIYIFIALENIAMQYIAIVKHEK